MYIYIVSPLLPNVCVHKVSCSIYCLNLFNNERFSVALTKSFKRIITCHPFNKLINKE